MSDSKEVISSSKSDIYSKLLDLASDSGYISNSSGTDNTDFLRAGEFGYITESLAMILRDCSFHDSMIYNESFLNTAVMPSSIYNWAKTFNIDCINATPAFRYVTLMMNTTDVNNVIGNLSSNTIDAAKTTYGITDSGNFMVIDKSNTLIAGNYYYSLEHSIEIYRSGTSNNYIVHYCTNELNKTTEFGDYSTTIIPISYSTLNGATYITLKVKMYQYYTKSYTKIITSSSFLDTRVHDFEYTGQACGLSLDYSKGSSSQVVTLNFSNLATEDTESSSSSEMAATYSLIDNNKIEINFDSANTTTLPQAGGKLTLNMFLTEGDSGNAAFTGSAVFVLKQNDYKSLSITATMDSTVSSNGVNQLSLSELKTYIINKLSMRNTIVTESDLNLWFESRVNLLSDLCNSKITFVKEQDTILKRSFSSYLLLRDGVSAQAYENNTTETEQANSAKVSSSYISSPVPTNTVDITYVIPDNTSAYYSISPNTVFYWDTETNSAISSTKSSSLYSYVCPFNIQVRLGTDSSTTSSNYTYANYYYIENSGSSSISISYVDELTNMTLIPTTLETSYNTSSNAFSLTFYVTTSAELSITGLTNLSLKINNNPSIDKTNFGITITKISDDSDTSASTYNYAIVLTPTATTGVTFNDETSETPSLTINGWTLYENNSFEFTFSWKNNTSKISNLHLKTTNKIAAFESLDTVMNSNIVHSANSKSFTIKSVPVVSSKWYASSINKEWFRKQLFVYISMLKESISKLETNTFFNIKFRNTYGLSKYYTIPCTNLRLKLKIYLKASAENASAAMTSSYSSVTVGSAISTLEAEIRDYIRILVDKSNTDATLKVSKIITIVQSAYANYIDHIDFLGLNDTFNQYVNEISTSNAKGVDYPLEYFCLDTSYTTTGSTVTSSNLDSDISFVTDGNY